MFGQHCLYCVLVIVFYYEQGAFIARSISLLFTKLCLRSNKLWCRNEVRILTNHGFSKTESLHRPLKKFNFFLYIYIKNSVYRSIMSIRNSVS